MSCFLTAKFIYLTEFNSVEHDGDGCVQCHIVGESFRS